MSGKLHKSNFGVARATGDTVLKCITVVGTGSGSVCLQRKSFRLLRTSTAAADDGEDVAIEKAEGGGQHLAEISDG